MRSLLEPFRFQTLSSLFWFAPCLSVRWVGCLVCLGFPPPLCCVYLISSLIFLHFLLGWKASTAHQHHQPVSQMLASVFQCSFRVLHVTRTLQRAWDNRGAGGGNSSVCTSEWNLGTPNTCRDKDGLENIPFMSICPQFLFVLHHYISHVFPYCLFQISKPS